MNSQKTKNTLPETIIDAEPKTRCIRQGSIFYVTAKQADSMRGEDLGRILVFEGSRGSGKTLSMSYMALCYLVKRHKVWSNYKIAFDYGWPGGTIEHFESMPLDMSALYTFDSSLSSGIVCIDELNLWASNRRSMSVANRLLNSVMQLIRKRRLTFMFTCQNFNWLDSQIRWQTDSLISCQDQHFMYPGRYGKGVMIHQAWKDMSGVNTGYPYSQTGKAYGVFFFGKRYWNIYDTEAEFDVLDATRAVKISSQPKTYYVGAGAEERYLNDTGTKTAPEAIAELKEYGKASIGSGELQEYLANVGFSLDGRVIGRMMRRAGYAYKQTRQGNFYEILRKEA